MNRLHFGSNFVFWGTALGHFSQCFFFQFFNISQPWRPTFLLSPPTIKKLPSSLNNKLQVVNNKLHTSDVEEFEKGAEGDDDDGEFNGDNDDDGDVEIDDIDNGDNDNENVDDGDNDGNLVEGAIVNRDVSNLKH